MRIETLIQLVKLKEEELEYEKVQKLKHYMNRVGEEFENDRWIPVNRFHPQEEEVVFALYLNKENNYETSFARWTDSHFYVLLEKSVEMVPVTHWCPIPQPPKLRKNIPIF